MSEWLTTGEMIDRLKVGEVAECETGEKVKIFPVYNTLEFGTVKNTLLWIDENGQPLGFYLTENNRAVKWRILSKYVSFEEAMNAFKKGKKVYFHGVGDYTLDEGVELPPKGMNISNSLLKEWNPYSLYIGKWTIED